jgi:hypothetical protein
VEIGRPGRALDFTDLVVRAIGSPFRPTLGFAFSSLSP